MKERVARLDANSARLDTKAATLLGFVSAASIFLATQSVRGWWKAVAYGAWAATVAFGLMALRVRRWKEAPEPAPLLELIAPRPEAKALELLTRAQVQAFEANKATHERKALHWRIGMGCLVGAVVLTAAALIFGGIGIGKQQRQPGPGSSSAPTLAPIPIPIPIPASVR